MKQVDRVTSLIAAKRPVGPPKIFGIGLGKTGTTSLHFAFELLGFRSIHASTLLCETINQEARNRLPLLSSIEEDYDAFTDWPISHLYAQLDRRFPHSKFILTERDPEARYQSAVRHIARDRTRHEEGLSHGWLSLASEDQFKSEQLRHTSKVTSYFKSRPNDLLVMRLTDAGNWSVLCGFLNVPVPDSPFPHHRALGSHESHYVRSSPFEPRPVNVNLDYWIRWGFIRRCAAQFQPKPLFLAIRDRLAGGH